MTPPFKNLLKLEPAADEKAAAAVQAKFQEGLALHQQGQLAQAQELYQQVLERQTNHFDALHLLGVIALQTNDPQRAAELIGRAIETNPVNAAAYNNRGNALQELRRFEEALASYDRALTLRPDYAEAHANRGNALSSLKRYEEALANCDHALKIRPDYAEAHSNRGNALSHLERHEEALASYDRALRIRPDYAEACNNRGSALSHLRRHEEALASYDHALEIKPEYAEAYCNRGNALRNLKRPEEALASYDRALAIKPDYAEAYANRGNALQDLQRHEEALASYDRALKIKPDYAEACTYRGNALSHLKRHEAALASYDRALKIKPDYAAACNDRGAALQELKRLDEALESYDQALRIRPDYAEALSNRGNALQDLGRYNEALESCNHALKIRPDYAQACNNRGNALQDLMRLDEALASYELALKLQPDYAEACNNRGNVLKELNRLDEALASYELAVKLKPDYVEACSNLLFAMTHHEKVDSAAVFTAHMKFGEHFEHPRRAHRFAHDNSPDPFRRLRLGFVSGDLRQHAVANFIEPVWAALDPDQVELCVYSNHHSEDQTTRRLRNLSHRWHKVAGLRDDDLAVQICGDKIDILFDLSGHTAHNRLLTFAYKPAPIQVTWIGYPNTTGLQSMDYMLCDRFYAPHGLYEHLYVEKFARLPSSSTFEPAKEAPPLNPLPAMSNGYVTFGSFNRTSKLGDDVIAAWSRVLKSVAGSRLLLGNIASSILAKQLTGHFGSYGIAAERLMFRSQVPLQDYLALHHEVDLILDTWPYTGGTVTNHALWMGVPVVTLMGPGRAHCQAAAALARLGLQDWIARDVDEFVRLAVHWANAPRELARLRDSMRERWQTAPLRQPATVARGLERAVRVMWQRWCAGLPAEHFEIEADAVLGSPQLN